MVSNSPEFVQKAASQSLGIMVENVTPARAMTALMDMGAKFGDTWVKRASILLQVSVVCICPCSLHCPSYSWHGGPEAAPDGGQDLAGYSPTEKFSPDTSHVLSPTKSSPPIQKSSLSSKLRKKLLPV
ncbi:TOG array regulator of axonemal microtubules protein 2-like [Melospiza georgiana]|uniref:TOG array regulator of axonemal microtubules protein 2-like n=1 Tax=Melospiza georgiana TaxID=44398 RepID=UPI0025ACAC14|nr:TOG array regulator of axonemal microtubules protein 2-like [Melospiza georgiana]